MNRKYYVFRINYADAYGMIRKELINGSLRQGWGAPGMTMHQGLADFALAWRKNWGANSGSDDYIKGKYNTIQLMTDMKPDDTIIIPKVDIRKEDGFRSFTVVKCGSKGYNFEPLNNDFGHIIDIIPIVSCSYDHDDATRTVNAKFKAYQKPINNVNNPEFIAAIDKIIENSKTDKSFFESADVSSINALSKSTSSFKEDYLKSIINQINKWQPRQLEIIIEELFEKNGYKKIANSRYDRNGGDIDLVFECNFFGPDTLMGDIFTLTTDRARPEVRVQAKKKVNFDTNDIEGAKQLHLMKDDKLSINILINLTEEFSDETKSFADENGIILINGRNFASLLIRYGIDIF